MIPRSSAARKPIEGRRDCSSHFSTSAQIRSAGRSVRSIVRHKSIVAGSIEYSHRAQDPQTVFDESVLIDDADDAARYVFSPAVRIEDFVLERVVHHCVDGEIAAARGLLKTHPRVAFYHKAAVPPARLGFATRK